MRARFTFVVLTSLLTGCVHTFFGGTAATSPDITEADTRHRIYLVADDSMQGRQSGAIGNFKMTEYLAREAARMGLEPAGDNGTYFQVIPMVLRRLDPASQLIAGNDTLRIFEDYAPIRPTATARLGTRIDVVSLPMIYGGNAGDTSLVLDSSLVAGKLIVFDAARGPNGSRSAVFNTAAGTEGLKYRGAAGIAIAALDLQTDPAALQRRGPGIVDPNSASQSGPGGILLTPASAARLMGADIATMKPGTQGRLVSAQIFFRDSAFTAPARNVVAARRGADAILRNEYVAIGAHNDHLEIASSPVEHDSLRAFNRVMRPEGSQTRRTTPTPEQWAQILDIRDSLRKIRPPRMDSIFNGADDDGSGSVALLEIAERFASQPRPKRSVLFVWHTAEEGGLLGSMYFTDHTTVPRESIVAQINMDMVGRGTAQDHSRGGPRNLQAIGMRRLSDDLGNVVDSVNRARAVPWEIDLSYDAPGHSLNRYCRSDHQNYARIGIPIVYFSRGYHQDYHVVTDEPQYIEYAALARVAGFVHDVAAALAERRDRPRVNKRLPSRLAPCRQ